MSCNSRDSASTVSPTAVRLIPASTRGSRPIIRCGGSKRKRVALTESLSFTVTLSHRHQLRNMIWTMLTAPSRGPMCSIRRCVALQLTQHRTRPLIHAELGDCLNTVSLCLPFLFIQQCQRSPRQQNHPSNNVVERGSPSSPRAYAGEA